MVNPLIVILSLLHKKGTNEAWSKINVPALPFNISPGIFKAICCVIEYVPLSTFIIPLGWATASDCSIVWNGASWLPSPPGPALDSTYKLYGFGSTVPVAPVGPVGPTTLIP